MTDQAADAPPQPTAELRLCTLERLLAIRAVERDAALGEAAHLLAEALGAEKVDVFLLDPSIQTLVAVGTSDTPMGRQQHAIGMDRLPIANGGRTVQVFVEGQPYLTGHADRDGDLPGLVDGLGIRSQIVVPLDIADERRGVVLASTSREAFFGPEHLRFLGVVADWVALVAARAELAGRLAEEAAAQARRQTAERLIAVLAHDLRNLLTPLSVRTQGLERRARQEGQERYARDAAEMYAGLARVARLVNDLLDAERLERGLFRVVDEPLDLAALARETAAAFGGGTVTVRVEGDERVPTCGDPARVRQALENLLANGVKHSPRGGVVTVEARAERRGEQDGGQLTVMDQGPGVAAEVLPRLFTRFGAGDESQGLGIGLYLSHRIAAAHGGTLTLDSAPGEGARFTLWLPHPAD